MGHFTIQLPSGRQADIRWGIIKKKRPNNFFGLFRAKKFGMEEKIGYIIHLGLDTPQPKQYRLLRTKRGEWLAKGDDGFWPGEDDEITAFLKEAITEYEKRR
jgi:hypothetical protein